MPKLIEYWRSIWWRRWSTWMAGLNAIFVGYVFSQPILVIGLLGFIPYGHLQIFVVVIAATLAFVLPVFVATLKQPALDAKIEEKKDAEPPSNAPCP